MKFKQFCIYLSSVLLLNSLPIFAADTVPNQSQEILNAQTKLTEAQGLYNLTKSQEHAVKDLRKASKLSLKASKLRHKSERIQAKADALLEKAKNEAVSRGLLFNAMDGPLKMDLPLENIEQSAQAPATNPVPGQPVNIYLPSNNGQTAYGAPVPGS